jgi:tetratricopeptide (TPR) repeat protein
MSGRGTWRTHTLAAAIIAGLFAMSGGTLIASAVAQSSAPTTGNVPVRFGSHATYDRLVFDFPDGVGYRVEQQGPAVTLVFDNAGPLNESQLTSGLSKVASGVSVARDGATTRVSLQMGEGLRLRHFRSGPRVVIDFSRSDTPQPAEATPPAEAPRPVAAAPTVAAGARPWERLPLAAPAAGPAAASVPAPVPRPAETAAAPTLPVSTAPAMPPWVQGSTALAPAPAAPAPAAAATATTSRPATAATRPAPAMSPAEQAEALAAVRAQTTQENQITEQVRAQSRELQAPPVATAAPTRLAPGAPSAAAPSPPRDGAAAATAAPDPARPAATPTPERSAAFEEARNRRTAERIAAADARSLGPPVPVVRSEGQGLRFKWPDPVTAAAFTRGPYVFLVFNKRAPLDLTALRSAPADDLVGEVRQIPSDGATLRLLPPPNTHYAIRSEGHEWVVEMTRRPRRPDVPATITTKNENDPQAARVLVTLRGGQAVISLKDPEVGDELRIVPTAVAGSGVDEAYDFPQFKILASAQGLVVQPEADGVIVRPLGQVIEIYSSKGLMLSSPEDVPTRSDPSLDPESLPRIFNFAEWRRDDGRPYLARKRELESALAAAPPNNRNPARLALARFLFAHGNAVEADGALETMALQTPAIANTRLFRSLRGAVSLMAGNLEEASKNLRHASLDREPELAMWRATLEMAEGSPRGAIEQISRGPDLSKEYPPPYNNRIGLAVAEALIELGDIPAARDRIEGVMASGPTPGEETQAQYLRGRLAILEGKPAEAQAIWTSLERGSIYSPARVLAALALVDQQLKENRITQAQAAQQVERLRYAWRGDDIEFAVLRRLGELEINAGEVRKGLASLRDLIALKPDGREVAAVTRQMSKAFETFFLDGAADKLSPITAIGMFREFQHLVPEGPTGNAMIRNLADRLIKVDLLDQAAGMLDNLIKTRLEGESKAEGGGRLAFTYLLDRKPAEALAAIEATELPGLSDAVKRDRDRLAARALADLNRPADALARIASDANPEADVLRAEINWNMENWAGAAQALGRLAGDPPPGDAAMPEEQSGRALRYAAALALAGDQAGLDAARTKYGPAMARGPFKDIFPVIASDTAGAMGDVRDIAARLASTAPFQGFLGAYRQRFSSGAARS